MAQWAPPEVDSEQEKWTPPEAVGEFTPPEVADQPTFLSDLGTAAKNVGLGLARQATHVPNSLSEILFGPVLGGQLESTAGKIDTGVQRISAGESPLKVVPETLTPNISAVVEPGVPREKKLEGGLNLGVEALATLFGGKLAGAAGGAEAEAAATRPSLTDTLFPAEKPPIQEAPIQPEEVKAAAEPIVQAAQPGPEVPELADSNSKGFVEAFSTAKGAVTDSFVDSIWGKVKEGEPIQRMGALENQLREAQKSGELKTREDVERIVKGVTLKLLPGETQGDLISSTQAEPLKLVGETGTDYVARQVESDAAAQAAEEARLKAEHEQGLLENFQQHQESGGMEFRDAIENAGGLPALSSGKHPYAGELNALREEFSTLSGKKRTASDYNQIFKRDAPQDIDHVVESLRQQGFDVETPSDVFEMAKRAIRGENIYGSEARGMALAGAGTPYEMSPQALGVAHPAPGFIKSIADYFTSNTPSQIWNTIKGSLDASLGKTFAKTTIADRGAGELGARWISAKIAAPHLAQTFATQVLEGTGVDPVKFGAALTEDNLRSIRAGAETPEAKAAVNTIIGAKNSPFKTEAEYQAFLKDPAVQQAVARHQELWQQTIDPMFKKAQMIDPSEPLASRGEQTGARINLYNDTEGTGKDVVGGTGKGNLTATFRKKSPFAIQAKGTGQSYNINYFDQMANTFGRQLEIASKNDFESKLVDSGNAIVGKPGENPVLEDGEKTVAFPLKRSVVITAEDGSKIPVNQNIYIRKSLSNEYRNAANVDRYDIPGVVKAFANVANKSALAGLTDASVHSLNLMTALFTRPGIVGGALSDSLLSTFGRADVPFTLTKVITKAFQDNRAQVADLASIGAMRADHPTINPMGKFIQVADRATRLVLDDTFKKLSDQGLVENTETNRREFVQQVGNYNIRAQGGLRRLARETGAGPFATAGTTFNTLGLRTATLSPGATATSPMAAGALRANVLSKWVGASVLVGTLNYLLTKDKGGGVMGRAGVPVGSVDSGLDDQNGRPLSFSVFNLLGLGRALRVTGIRGAMESQRKGLNLSTALDASARDVFNTSISPFTGPVIRFGTEAASGYQPAIGVPRATHVAAPGENQTQQNIKDAILDANPILKSIALSKEPGGTVADAVRQQIPRMSLTPSQRPEMIERYGEIVHKAQASGFIDDVVRRARNMKPEARSKFVNDSLDKLTDEDRAHAVKTLKYRKIEY